MIKAIGILLFFLSCFGLYWVGKRAFNRRNAAGVQQFNSYGGALAANAIEGIVKIASWLGIALGFMMFCVGYGFGR